MPERLQVKAAQTATRINPANGLNIAALASLEVSDGVIDPLRIAVLTAKYWGPQQRQLTVSFSDCGFPVNIPLRRFSKKRNAPFMT